MADATLFDFAATRKKSWSRRPRKNPEEGFWERVDKRGPDECWPWIGFIHRNGYGSYCARRWPTRMAHRISYLIAKGAIPDGYEIDHLCKNTRCVNPKHLEAVTPKENNARSTSRSALNIPKTHCPKGHPYSGKNLRVYRGCRYCKTCNLETVKLWKRRKRLREKSLGNI